MPCAINFGERRFECRSASRRRSLVFDADRQSFVRLRRHARGRRVDRGLARAARARVNARSMRGAARCAQRRRARGQRQASSCKAMMPGRVVNVLVKLGDEVAAQQGVLVVEAMKMENELKAPKAGKVVEVKVTAGQTVEKGEVAGDRVTSQPRIGTRPLKCPTDEIARSRRAQELGSSARSSPRSSAAASAASASPPAPASRSSASTIPTT